MKKSTQQLIVISIFFSIIVLVFVYFGFVFFDDAKKTLNPENQPSSSNQGQLIIPEFMSAEEINRQPLLKEAKGIIDLVGQESDSNQVYGWGKYCNRQNDGKFACELELIKTRNSQADQTYYASYKYMASQIWARYHYYRVTGDKAEYEKLKKDIDALTSIVDGGIWRLQSNRFLCLYFQDLVSSQLISSDYKDKLFKICFANDYERHPDSLVSYSQNNHHVFKYTNMADYGDDLPPLLETPVSYDYEKRYPLSEEIIHYEKTTIIDNINSLLKQMIDNQVIKTDINSEQSLNFMRRHIMAAIDIIGKINLLKQKSDNVAIEKAELDYLLFTWETLNWYVNQPDVYKHADICMIKENIQYFLNNYENKLSKEQKEKILAKFNHGQPEPQINYCLLAGAMINNKTIDANNLYERIKKFNLINNSSDWDFGYLPYYDFGDLVYYFPHDENSVAAGLLIINNEKNK